MSSGANPYILFLILILLILGTDPEAGQKMENVKNVMERMSNAMNNFRSGMNSLAVDFQEIHLMMQGMNKPAGAK